MIIVQFKQEVQVQQNAPILHVHVRRCLIELPVFFQKIHGIKE